MGHELYTKHCMYSISFNCLTANEKVFYYPHFRIKQTANSQGWSNWYKVPSDSLCHWTQIQFCLTTNCMLLIIMPVFRAALGRPGAPGTGPGENKPLSPQKEISESPQVVVCATLDNATFYSLGSHNSNSDKLRTMITYVAFMPGTLLTRADWG